VRVMVAVIGALYVEDCSYFFSLDGIYVTFDTLIIFITLHDS
jgi:hypothetical protein